jgi:hypothetical protein
LESRLRRRSRSWHSQGLQTLSIATAITIIMAIIAMVGSGLRSQVAWHWARLLPQRRLGVGSKNGSSWTAGAVSESAEFKSAAK